MKELNYKSNIINKKTVLVSVISLIIAIAFRPKKKKRTFIKRLNYIYKFVTSIFDEVFVTQTKKKAQNEIVIENAILFNI